MHRCSKCGFPESCASFCGDPMCQSGHVAGIEEPFVSGISLCNTCSKANSTCPIYPQQTHTCVSYVDKRVVTAEVESVSKDDPLSEESMSAKQAYEQTEDALMNVNFAISAQGADRFREAAEALEKAIYQLGGAMVICRSKADKLAAELERIEREQAEKEEEQHL